MAIHVPIRDDRVHEDHGGHIGVLFLLRSFGFPTGMAATNRVALMALALRENGVDVRVLCLRASERLGHLRNSVVRGSWKGVPFRYAPGTTVRSPRFIARRWHEVSGYARALVEIARLRHSGWLDCAFFVDSTDRWRPANWLLQLWCRLVGARVVVQLNEVPGPVVREPAALARRLSHLAQASAAVVISEWLAGWVYTEAARTGRSVAVMKMPILVDLSERATRPYRSTNTLVYSASTDYGRDTEFILRAMKCMWAWGSECVLVVTGVDPARLAYWRRSAGLGNTVAEPRVVAAGYLSRDQLLASYDDAAALLAPLHDDVRSCARFPSKIGEYLASARPVVTTNVGEVARYLSDGDTAFVAEGRGVEDYAAKIMQVLDDPQSAAAVGLAGRRIAEEMFDYRLHGARLAAFFRSVARA